MVRPALEVADIFRAFGPAWRLAQHGHLSLGQLKVMSAIEQCRTAALGGHVLRCEACEQIDISYNSCRNRHCPKCQARAAQRWLEARQADLLPVEYYHVVFTLPAPISALAYTNKALVYRLLFEVAAETLLTIAADPKHLGATIGATLVLHTWGSAMTHHPHVHGIVPGGGLSADGQRWIACRHGFFLPVRVLSRLFRRRFLEELAKAHHAGVLRFLGELAPRAQKDAFQRRLAPLPGASAGAAPRRRCRIGQPKQAKPATPVAPAAVAAKPVAQLSALSAPSMIAHRARPMTLASPISTQPQRCISCTDNMPLVMKREPPV